MRLDVIIPTYNRSEMLVRTLDSLLAAEVPPGLEVRVTVVDNNSTDRTRQTVEEQKGRFGGRLNYVFETRQGRSCALNAGIEATDGDLVGMIDDDEEIDARWFECVRQAFEDEGVDFIGGRCLPRWGAAHPAWLPRDYPGVIGWIDSGDEVLPFDENYPGILMGGNAVLRRSTIEKVGLYATSVSRNSKRLLSGEDHDMYQRLLASGARGLYQPDLIIHHYVPPERLTKRYFRRWCFWNGVSHGVIEREHRTPVAYLLGVPRYLYGRAARGMLRLARAAFKREDPARSFSDELAVWDFAGFFYGKHFYKVAR
jgi:glycosyltransferase involved in cell wall biosynthesis